MPWGIPLHVVSVCTPKYLFTYIVSVINPRLCRRSGGEGHCNHLSVGKISVNLRTLAL